MYKGKKIIGVIPARGGSKGIPGKNIKPCAGKPLIAYTIEAANGSELLDGCIVTTDDEDIAQVSRESGADVPFMRPAELATDTARGIDVMIHAYKWACDDREEYDYCILLQPTSPLRTSEDIDNAIRTAVDNDADSVMSMYELIDMSLPKLKVIRNNQVFPLFQDEGSTTAQRTAAEPIYKRNCAIYLTKGDTLLSGNLFGEKQYAYIMPDDRSVDINEPFEFDLAEFLLQKKSV